MREIHEEASTAGARIVEEVACASYEGEDQRVLLAEAPDGLPDSFSRTVTAEGVDQGLRYESVGSPSARISIASGFRGWRLIHLPIDVADVSRWRTLH